MDEIRKNLFAVNKLGYARGDRPDVECILCAVKDKNKDVPNLTIEETELSIVSVNLFPYNPGHLIIFPKRHVLDLEDLQENEIYDMHKLRSHSIKMVKKAWHAQGFNIGYNLGKFSGGSIPHIHEHIVPRFPNEVGFIDVLSNTRVVVYDPYVMYEELKKLWCS